MRNIKTLSIEEKNPEYGHWPGIGDIALGDGYTSKKEIIKKLNEVIIAVNKLAPKAPEDIADGGDS